MQTINLCPHFRKYICAVGDAFKRIDRTTVTILLSLVSLHWSYWTNHWIMVCAPLATSSNTFDLYHKNHQFEVQTMQSDTDNEMCLSIGLLRGTLSMPDVPPSFLYIGYMYHPFVQLSSWLLFLSIIITPISAIFSFSAAFCLDSDEFKMIQRRFLLILITLPLMFSFVAVTLFTLYKERRASVINPADDVFKDMLNNFSGRYGYSYCIAWVTVLINFVSFILVIFSYAPYSEKTPVSYHSEVRKKYLNMI